MIGKKENVPSLNTGYKGVVYITTNLVNGKKYIGKDTRNLKNYLGSGILLKKSILKYGREFFIKDILAYGNSNEDLSELEKYYIDYYGAVKSGLFYNITEGGLGGKTIDQTHKKVCISQFDLNGNFLRSWESAKEISDELGVNRSKIVSVCSSGHVCHGFMYKRCNDIRIVKRKVRNSDKYKSVSKYNPKGVKIAEYESLSQACREEGIKRSHIYSNSNVSSKSNYWIINNKK